MAQFHQPGPCPECRGHDLWTTSTGSFVRGIALLPNLGELFSPAEIHLVLCKQCGLLRMFAENAALKKLGPGYWRKISVPASEGDEAK